MQSESVEVVYDHYSKILENMGYMPDTLSVGERHNILHNNYTHTDILKGRAEAKTERDTRLSKYADSYACLDDVNFYETTNLIFWVGVEQGVYPSKPIKRMMTNCYSPAKVYVDDKHRLIFDLYDIFYEVPECEQWALQENK